MAIAAIFAGNVSAAVVATFPASPRLILGYLLTDDPQESSPLIIDFNSDGAGDIFFKGGGPMIDFFVSEGNRVIVETPPPPNIGGLLGNLPTDRIIGPEALEGSLNWYGGFPAGSVAESYGLPSNLNAVAFSDLNTHANNGNFFNSSGYIGVEFFIEGNVHYGWVHVSNETALGHGGYIDAWAYNSIPGEPIKAGQIPECRLLWSFAVLPWLMNRRRPDKIC